LIDRRMRGGWLNRGGKDLAEAARKQAMELLKTHKPEPLPAEVLAKLRAIVQSAEG
jgi:trimethylamine--corrinoid protein Co-methyltransferase